MNAVLDSSSIDLLLSSGLVAKLLLVGLLFASIASWSIILYKWVAFRRVNAENRRFLVLFSRAEDLEDIQVNALKRNKGPMASILRVALEKIDAILSRDAAARISDNGTGAMRLSAIERTLQGALQDEMTHQERYLHLLATIGNTAPFLGLFGTVWGIMSAFQEIGLQGSANIAVVAPGVAEALITTAAGLFVAIPASVGYNLFIHKIRSMHVHLEVFSSEVMTLVEEMIVNRSVEQGVR